MMKRTLGAAALLALSVLAMNTADAHGTAKPQRGGVVATANDLVFELVGTPGGAAIYIDDHGKPLPAVGMSGKITVLNGSEKAEAELSVAADRLEAKGIQLAPGAKVVAALMTPARKAVTVRFTVK